MTFCGHSCASIFSNKLRSGYEHSRRLTEYRCTKCDVLLATGWNAHVKNKQRKTCVTCNSNYLDWNTTTLADMKENCTSGSFHGKIRCKSRTVYKKSNKPKCCAVCGYDKHYDVCHIKALKDFSLDATLAEVNHIDNLVAMCPNHHWEHDNISP